jgi:subfamily B ATP-binding cassette protein MsbA
MSFIIYYFKVFYRYTGIKLFLFILLVLITTLIDGFALSITLPILEFGNDIAQRSSYSNFIYSFLETLGIRISIISLVIFIVIIFAAKGLIKFTQEAIGSNILYQLQHRLRTDIIELYRKMKYSYFIKTEIGYFNNIITTEIGTTVSAFRKYTTMIAKSVMILSYLFYCFLFSWEICLMAIVAACFIYFLFRPLTLKVRKLSKILVESHTDLQNGFIQFILNFKYLKATSNFEEPTKKIRFEIDRQRKKGFILTLFENFTPISLELVAMILFSLGVIFLIEIKGFSIGSILVMLLFLHRSMLRLPEFQSSLQAFMAQTGSVDVVEEARSILVRNTEKEKGKDIIEFSSGISLQQVNFSFENTHILHDINIKIPHNSTIGIVGKSGSGKTTLLDLITGLLISQSGRIEIDGKEYNDLNLISLRNLFGYITQEPIIFNDSIFNNVTLWSSDENDPNELLKVESICKIAHCSDFIKKTEQGYSTIVGDRGIKLSGGQCQRIAIARELFRNSEIIIFDEATSSLDSRGEKTIQDSINKLIGQKTLIIIAHRLSTVRNCNHIYVIDDGRVVQSGSWDDLINDSNSMFVEMCQLQGITK